MGRPKGSTVHSDTKIIVALLHRPRRFSEFEWALVEEYGRDLPEDAEARNPEYWKRFVKSWRLPRKTLARRLKAFLAKDWVIRTVLPLHGHNVEYRLNFSKMDEMVEELPVPELRLVRSQARFMRKVDAVIPLKEELPGLEKLSADRVVEIFFRLRSGEFVCPNCLAKGECEKALDVLKNVDGRFYCRNCGQEVLLEECEKLLKQVLGKEFSKKLRKSRRETLEFLDGIRKQLEESK